MHEAPSRLPFPSRTLRCALLLAPAACEGCSGTSEPSDEDVVAISSRGSATTFDVGTWNLEWFGDAARWSFSTAALSAAGTTTIIGYGEATDHQLLSNEAWAGYEIGSAEAYRVDAYIPEYGKTATDHYPVLARYRIGS